MFYNVLSARNESAVENLPLGRSISQDPSALPPLVWESVENKGGGKAQKVENPPKFSPAALKVSKTRGGKALKGGVKR